MTPISFLYPLNDGIYQGVSWEISFVNTLVNLSKQWWNKLGSDNQWCSCYKNYHVNKRKNMKFQRARPRDNYLHEWFIWYKIKSYTHSNRENIYIYIKINCKLWKHNFGYESESEWVCCMIQNWNKLKVTECESHKISLTGVRG